MRCALRREGGYSLIELISIIVVIGALTAFASSRFVDQTGFASRGFYDQAQALVAYAQKIAVAQRRTNAAPIYVAIAANGIRVCYDAACATPVPDPNTGNALTLNAPSGITLTPVTTFSFGNAGAPSAAVTIRVNSTGVGDINRTFFVETQTGYVHP